MTPRSLAAAVLRLAALTALALQVGAARADAQDDAERSRRVDSLFARYGPGTPGVAVRVVRAGRVVHAGEYGMANLEHGVPVSAETVFAIGSNSKQFTGLAIDMLAAQGALDLDADVREYVPGLPDFGDPITVRQLLHHTSGLRDWVRPLFMVGGSAGGVTSFDQILAFTRRQQDLNFRPGTQHMYSNTGYNLLAEVVTQVTGTPFPQWMAENVFEPLGMEHTRVRATPYDLVEHMASSYYPARGGYLSVHNGLAAYGSCCVLSTADDMVKWLENFRTAGVGGADVLDLMQSDTVGTLEYDGRLVGYAHGLQVLEYHGHSGFYHSGQWVGFRSATIRIPEQELAIVVLGNNGPTANLREFDILDLYAEPVSTVAEEAAEGEETEPGTAASIEDLAVALPAATLDRYAGTYDFSTPDGSSEVLVVRRRDDRLEIKFTTDREPSVWTPISETEFKSRPTSRTLAFEAPASGPATAALWNGRSWPRTEPFDPTPEQLADYTGTFHSPELDATWRFEIEDGERRLVATQILWGGTLTFTPTVRDTFRGRSQITSAHFVRDRAGRVTEVIVSGRRTLNVRFLKGMGGG